MTALFQTVLYMSLAGAYVFLIVLLARLLLSKCPKKYTYFLWFLVFLRFACPVFPEGPFSLLPSPDVRIKAEIGMDRVLSQGSAFGMENAFGHQGVSSDSQGEEKGEEVFFSEGSDNVISYSEKAPGEQPQNLFQNFRSVLSELWYWLPFLWAFGAVIFLFYHILSYVRLKSQLSKANEVEPGVYEFPGEHISFVAGFFHPAIYISGSLEPEARQIILCHERVHLRRRDYLIKPIFLVISCIHWFNPFVWLAFCLMNRDMEISCDEWVLEELGEGRKEAYSRALLRAADGGGFACRRKGSICSLLSFGENGVKNRIRHMLTYRRASFWAAVSAVAVLVLLALGILMNPRNTGFSEEDFVQIVRTAGGYGEDKEVRCFARDYDGDGKPEAYVEMGSLQDGYIEGELWFVSGQGRPTKLRENILMQTEQEYFEQDGDVYLLMSYIDGNPLLTDVYGVWDGSNVHFDFPSPEQKYVEDGKLMCIVSDYDMDYDMEMGTFAGHTRKAYPFYYESDEDGGYWGQYEARTITREDVKKYENGQEILWAIEEANPGCRYEYLLRENGLLHINRAQVTEDFIGFAYTTCEIQDNRMSLLGEGEGCYRKVLYSGIDEPGEEEQKSFVVRVAEEYADKMWDPKEGEYRSFAEEVRHCLERDDVDGLHEKMADMLQFSGDKALEELRDTGVSFSNDAAMAVFQVTDRDFFDTLYEYLFTPEMKEAIFQSDFNKIFVDMDGAWIGTGEWVLQFRPVEGEDGEYKVVTIHVE